MAARRPRNTPMPTTTATTQTPTQTPPRTRSGIATSAAPAAAVEATFAELGVPADLIKALAAQGITAPFPIQTATLPDSLSGRDVLGRGRTGSGKTYAFAIPLVARLAASKTARTPGRPRALILAPTRELATQIDATLAPLAAAFGLRTITIFGGVSPGRQISGLRAGVDIVVACPGRLADHLQSGHVRLDAIEITILDEADHMADLGFLPVVRRLMDQTPKVGQRMLFSATLDGDVNVLVRRFLSNPVTHSVDSSLSPVAAMAHHVLHIQSDDRLAVLTDLASAPGRTLVFTRTKRGAKMLTRRLVTAGVPAVELHGNLAQNARNRNLEAFSTGEVQTLVATDIAARGIHVDDIGLVVHFDPPTEHKAYLHRSGRTARAGANGTVITLMSDEQVRDVRDLTRRAGIDPTTTRLRPGHELLAELAPGERTFVKPPVGALVAERDGASGRGTGRGSGRGGGGGRRGSSSSNSSNGSGGSARSGRASRAGSGRSSSSASSATVGRTVSAPKGAAAFSAGSRAGSRRGGR
jgi:superfamily II DNA/RNA helicase